MGTPVGRNDPCPCGSGKKHKRCCGAAANDDVRVSGVGRGEPVTGWARAHAIWPKTREALLSHTIDWLGQEAIDESFDEFEGPDPRQDGNADWLELFFTWHLYDWVPDGETKTVAAHWLAEPAGGRDRGPDVVRLVRSANEHALCFFQVQGLDPGRGVVLRNLLTHEERFVVDRSLSESLPPWTVIVARLIEFSGIVLFDAVGPRALPPDFSSEAVRWIEENLECSLPISEERVRHFADDLIECYLQAVAADDERRSRRPSLHTSDGELVVMCKDIFRIAKGKRKEVLDALLSLGLEIDGNRTASPTKFVWLKNTEGESPPTLLGTLRLEKAELVLEVNSRERRERMKALLAESLSSSLELVDSEEQSQELLLSRGAEPRSANVDDTEEIPPEIAQAMIREYATKHYSSWPDAPLPALDGRTPREAMKSPEGRSALEELIRDMEHRSHGTPMAGAYDFDDLRRALGLIPPCKS
jgi:hypothetical protein